MPKTPITKAFFGLTEEEKPIELSLVKATLINTDGTLKELEPKNGKTFKYEEIREVIGNIIQPLCLRYYTTNRFKSMNFIVDEEGAINGQPLNPVASFVLRQILGPGTQDLYGPVIFLPNKMFRMY